LVSENVTPPPNRVGGAACAGAEIEKPSVPPAALKGQILLGE